MSLSKKNIIEGIIGSLIATAIVYFLGVLLSNIDIIIAKKPLSENSAKWNFEIQPIIISLPHFFQDMINEVIEFKKNLHNFFFFMWTKNVWMMIFTGYVWGTVFMVLPWIRLDFVERAYLKANCRKRYDKYKRVIPFERIDKSHFFINIILTYAFLALLILLLSRNWFFIFCLSLFTERLYWILTVFIKRKRISNDQKYYKNIIYIILSFLISIIVSFIFIIILSYIFSFFS